MEEARVNTTVQTKGIVISMYQHQSNAAYFERSLFP